MTVFLPAVMLTAGRNFTFGKHLISPACEKNGIIRAIHSCGIPCCIFISEAQPPVEWM